MQDDALSLDQLSRAVQARLNDLGLLEAQPDGRVAAAPDAHTVRYYGTLGLVDRPRIVDREARYGRRHVLQLVAIKTLQAQGLPLAEVQKSLYARSNSELESLMNTVTMAPPSPDRDVRAIRWHEVTIVPGLKLMMEEHWSPGPSPVALEDRIRAALAALGRIGGPTS